MVSPDDFKDVAPADVPEPAGTELLDRAGLLGYRLDQESDFDRIMRVNVAANIGEYCIYAAVKDRSWGLDVGTNSPRRIRGTKGRNTDRTIFMVDSLVDDEVAGFGAVSLCLTSTNPYSVQKPIVLAVETSSRFLRQGYGHRRYLAMNAAAHLVFGYPLHSRENNQAFRSEYATRRWEALVRIGLAESYEEISESTGVVLQRYRFI